MTMLRTIVFYVAMFHLGGLVFAAPTPSLANSTDNDAGSGAMTPNETANADQTHEFLFNCNFSSDISKHRDLGSLRRGLNVLKKYAGRLSRENLQREDVPDISYQFRFDGYRNERDVTTQDLANWYVVFGAYANLTEKVKNASVSGEEERRMTTLLQVLVGVLNDYNKVITPDFCNCTEPNCIEVASRQPETPSDDTLASYIVQSLRRDVAKAKAIVRSWKTMKQYSCMKVTSEDWISEHRLSNSPDYATIAKLYGL